MRNLPYTSISFRIYNEDYEKIKSIAQIKEVSIANLFRQAMNFYLRAHPGDNPLQLEIMFQGRPKL